jgi:hypothetical protein
MRVVVERRIMLHPMVGVYWRHRKHTTSVVSTRRCAVVVVVVFRRRREKILIE